MRVLLYQLVCPFFFVLCALAAPYVSLSQTRRPRIVNGSNVPSSEFPAVTPVILNQQFLCTGTLIAPKYVLTAAHCFFDSDKRRNIGDTEAVMYFNGQLFRSKRVYINPAYNSFNICADSEPDAALIEMEREVLDIPPVQLAQSPVEVNSVVTLVGYGEVGRGALGAIHKFPEPFTVEYGIASIDAIDTTYIAWTFDHGESNTAPGDSGSPAFLDDGASRYIVGLTCGGTGNSEFGTVSVDTRADILGQWINSVLVPEAPLTLSSATLLFFSPTSGRNFLGIVGEISIPAGFVPAGKIVTVRIGKFTENFRLTARGTGHGGRTDKIALRGPQRRGEFLTSSLNLRLNIKSRAAFRALMELGVPTMRAALPSQIVQLPVRIELDGLVWESSAELQFQSELREWRVVSGSFRGANQVHNRGAKTRAIP
jgi:hypothetical protein